MRANQQRCFAMLARLGVLDRDEWAIHLDAVDKPSRERGKECE
jgi:hypothetical protein